MVKLDLALASRPSTSVATPTDGTLRTVSVAPTATRASSRVKLPKLSIPPFNGELTTWTPFWESYEAAIHKNLDLSDTEKFNYLRSLLRQTALDSISGLALTTANYAEAISILHTRFGNKQQIVARHMDALMNADTVASAHNIKGLRRLYDYIETHIRSLRSLGVESSSYGTLLASILINKIPEELQLIVSRKNGAKDWNLDSLMVILGEELQVRERMKTVSVPNVKKPSKDPATAATLLAGAHKITCSYCQQDHPSNSCGVVAQPQARKQVLQKVGRCFICLRRGHISRECTSHKKCSKCNGRHHISICMKGTNSTPQQDRSEQTRSNTSGNSSVQPDPPAASRSGLNVEASSFQARNATSTSLCVNSSQTILLQTAQAMAFNPSSTHR